jgi:hypothetical protein
VDLENLLGQVDADNLNLRHGKLPSAMNTTPEHKPGSAMPQSGAVPHHHTSGWTNSTGVDQACRTGRILSLRRHGRARMLRVRSLGGRSAQFR